MRKQSIVSKIVITVSGVVIFLLILGGLALMKLEKDMIERFSQEYLEKITQSISEREEEEKKMLRKNIAFNSKILSLIGAADIYNYTAENLQQTLARYLESPEILAIQVTDEFGGPFAAAWKSPDISWGKSFPGAISLDNALFVQFDSVVEGKKLGNFKVYYTESTLSSKIEKVKIDAVRESEAFHRASHLWLNQLILSQSVVGGIVILIQIVLLTLLLRKLIIRPLGSISTAAHRLADLDLTLNIDNNGKDEVGNLMVSIRRMTTAFKAVVTDVKSKGERLASASSQMTRNINKIAVTTGEMSANVHRVSKTAARMSQNMNTVAGAIEQISASINEVGMNAREELRISGDAVAMAEKAGNTMGSLGESAIQIGEVTEVIKRIAEKTTLLALNADIEAASAGEAGRGFAVVANEIKAFARQSTRAADDIAARISAMQRNTEQAVAVIGEVSHIIDMMNRSTEATSFTLEEQMKAVNEIAANALQADVRANEIAASIARLAQGASAVSANVGMAAGGKGGETRDADACHIDASAAEVARLASELLELVDRFIV